MVFGWSIFKSSLVLFFTNLVPAILLTGIFWLAFGLLSFVMGYPGIGLFSYTLTSIGQPGSVDFPYIQVASLVLVGAILFAWGAISWHRFLILEERPIILPKWPGMRVLAYLLQYVLIVILLFIFTIILAFPLGMFGHIIAANSIASFLVYNILITAIITYLSLRISMVLPAIGVGANLTISESWKVTAPFGGAIITLSLLLTLVQLLVQEIASQIASMPTTHLAFSFIADWVNMVLGFTILTYLYSHVVEDDTQEEV